MSWNADSQKVAIKVIGTVESNLKYDSINYRDPITVGMMQWYGTRAASFLNELRASAAWVGVADSLTDDLVAYPETNSSFWTSRYLSKNEGESLRPVLRSAIGKQVQYATTLSDLEEYKYQAGRVFIDAETETDQFIYFCVMYHQSPRYARQIVNGAGTNPSLDRLHSMVLNHSWYSSYASRYNTARQMIIDQDSAGIPDIGTLPDASDANPEDGEEGGDAGGTGGIDGATQTTGNILNIQLIGNALHVHTKDGVVICQPGNTGSMWTAGVLAQPTTGVPVVPVPDVPDPVEPVPPSGDATATQAALVAFLVARLHLYTYTQGAGRNSPDTSGKTDCSALQAYAYLKVANIKLGGDTVAQHTQGKSVWSNLPGSGNAGGTQPPLTLLQAGDLAYFSHDNTYSRVRHVEMYMGDGRFIGWGGNTNSYPWPGKGPYIKTNAVSYMNYYKWITVRRHV